MFNELPAVATYELTQFLSSSHSGGFVVVKRYLCDATVDASVSE